MSHHEGTDPSASYRDDIYAGVLVGGRGRRLGGLDKARLPVPAGAEGGGGETLIQRTVRLLRPLVAEVVLAGRADQAYPETLCPWVDDEPAGIGPLGGLNALLQQPPRPLLFLIACDLPRLAASDLLAMLATQRRVEARAVVPVSAAGTEPTCALYHVSVRQAVEAAIARRQHALRAVVQAVAHVRVQVPAPLQDSLTNINTPRDMERLSHPLSGRLQSLYAAATL